MGEGREGQDRETSWGMQQYGQIIKRQSSGSDYNDNKLICQTSYIQEINYIVDILPGQYVILDGMAPYRHLLLAPAEGWWPSATWSDLRAL